MGVEGFVTAIVDQNAQFLRRGKRKELFILAVCIVSFFIGLPMVTEVREKIINVIIIFLF